MITRLFTTALLTLSLSLPAIADGNRVTLDQWGQGNGVGLQQQGIHNRMTVQQDGWGNAFIATQDSLLSTEPPKP